MVAHYTSVIKYRNALRVCESGGLAVGLHVTNSGLQFINAAVQTERNYDQSKAINAPALSYLTMLFHLHRLWSGERERNVIMIWYTESLYPGCDETTRLPASEARA
jgi:hypothetical protein